MNKKIWCFFGVHEYEIIEKGPYDRYLDGELYSTGHYYNLRCKVRGKITRTVTAKK